MSSLNDFIDPDGHIVATFINAGYFEYIHNLSINLKKLDIPWKLCVVCTDEDAHNLCKTNNIPSILFSTETHISKEYSSWNDSNWNNVTFAKLSVILWMMSCPNIKSITYMDGDIHVYRDFMPYLKSLDTNKYDICIQSDAMSADPNVHTHHLCSGFFHFANRETARKLFEFTEQDVKTNTFNADQQHIVNKVAEHNMCVYQLPRDLFPNGVFYANIPSNPYILHYNYMVGTKKKQNMNTKGHWYLSARKVFHQPTTVVYPPFKNGIYLEEYFSRHNTRGNYIDVFWTNLQIDPRYRAGLHPIVQNLVNREYCDVSRHYFTVVQHDDGVMVKLPPNTTVYAAGGTGHVPLPLIYEDNTNRLEEYTKYGFNEKTHLCSFVGSITHKVREQIMNMFYGKSWFKHQVYGWTNQISQDKQESFVEITSKSKFCLAPRGYGRSSFRFYEAFQLGAIPIYVWDDIEWLPYMEFLDYSRFCISIHVSKIGDLESKLLSITEEQYMEMCREYENVKHWFSLEGMTKYILERETGNNVNTK
jgi:hypothetical protein